MHHVHQSLLYAHIATGLVAIIAFWLPVAARKGSDWHIRAGRFYVWAMYAVTATAFSMCVLVLVNPVGIAAGGEYISAERAWSVRSNAQTFAAFLLMLSLLVLSALRHGLLALRLKSDANVLKRPMHRALIIALGVVSVLVGWVGVDQGRILLMVFAVLGINGAIRMFRETLRSEWTRGEMVFAHLNGLLGTGIGAYTAVFAFGGSRLLAELLPGQLQVIPWVTPAIVGTIAVARMKRHYVRKTTEPRRAGAVASIKAALTRA